jgi:hypothetical protein
VELSRRLLTSVTTLPAGTDRPRAVLKIVILSIAEYGSPSVPAVIEVVNEAMLAYSYAPPSDP